MQMLQQPDKITILYSNDHEVRHVRMNQPHPPRVTPSWYGDSVGHYEGDTLVIDTIGIKIGPFAMVDMYGTPHSPVLHVVERYRLLDYEAAKEAEERGQRELTRFGRDPGFARNPGYKGNGLQLEFTVEDDGVFTRPWSAAISYRRPLDVDRAPLSPSASSASSRDAARPCIPRQPAGLATFASRRRGNPDAAGRGGA
jgi:hypothetical protein